MPANYSKQNLQGKSFKNKNLKEADFSHSQLAGVSFKNSILCNACFKGMQGGLQWLAVLAHGLGFLALTFGNGFTAFLISTSYL